MRFVRTSIVVVLAALCCIGQAQFSCAQDAKISVLIVTGHDVKSHPWRITTPFLRKTLERSGKFDVKVCEDTSIFESSRLDRYDVLVLNYGFWDVPQLSERAKQGLLDYVRSGGGLVPLHFACSSYQDWDEYAELLGRVWVKGTAGHGPRGKFTVKIIDKKHPITAGMLDFVADDELYAKLSGDADIQVLATADSDWSNQTEPIVFVKKYGKGNVVHNLLGHDLSARDYAEYIQLFLRGTEWAARGRVTE
jgi:type 1 glutamine amidotransferase